VPCRRLHGAGQTHVTEIGLIFETCIKYVTHTASSSPWIFLDSQTTWVQGVAFLLGRPNPRLCSQILLALSCCNGNRMPCKCEQFLDPTCFRKPLFWSMLILSLAHTAAFAVIYQVKMLKSSHSKPFLPSFKGII
jgi:hypothetical protein